MSLYALFPGPQPNTAPSGSSLSRATQSISPADFTATMSKQSPLTSVRDPPKVVLDFSKFEDSSLSRPSFSKRISRTNSLSTAETEALSMSTSSFNSSCTSSSSSSSSSSLRHDQDLKIWVQEVKVNFNKLARPTSSKKSTCSKSVCRSKRDGRLRRRKRSQDKKDYDATAGFNSYEKAIEFELTIRFVGRNYSTKRTLSQIAQLRQDLMEEMAFGERLVQHRSLAQGCCDEEEDASNSSWESGSSDEAYDIPSLPRMSEAGVFGGGFAQMNGMMQAFQPALEGWFQTVAATVSDDSPVLAGFLWEPLNEDALHASLHQLGSIQEK